ncbi:hypothetical protein ACH5RR_026211 [Cinchona calisaya]|uniref:DUF8040 domain-containing protein n=1 Tax=Cinchona calisaya TaxID=153742 RepID=A0ABD2Z1W1_9GENT
MIRDIGGLRDTRNMTLEEIVAMFVYVLAHHKKNRTVAHKFLRSGETVSRHFNQCLLAVLKLHHMLLKTPVPICDDCTDDRWKYFKPGWEGSAHDERVLRDAISRPNGLQVPQGRRPESAEEYFNMKHDKARNVIERYVASELYKLEKLNFTFKRMENIHEISIATQQRGRVKNKCFWADNEVKALIEALQEMACDPLWKTGGGFKNGFMVELHKMVAHKIPDFTKQVDPHIDSKLKWLKSRYHPITEMVKKSGCEWDNVEKIIKCERQWYDSWAKRHKEASGLWNMKFPYLDELELVYGKDRANGEAVEDYEDAVNNLEAEEKSAETASYVNYETDDEISISTSRIQKRQTAHLSKKSKKLETSAAPAPSPMEAQFEMVTNKFISSIDGIASHFASIATAMTNEDKREQLASDRSNSLVAELLKLELCEGDTFRVA